MSEGLVKIKIVLPGSDWYTFKTETIWAEMLGDNLYKLKNSPFFADSISYDDVVFAVETENNDGLLFKSVRQRSTNSTYRIMLAGDTTRDEFNEMVQPLVNIGCTYSGYKDYQFALNVPATVEIEYADEILKKGEQDGYWFYEASHRYDGREQL